MSSADSHVYAEVVIDDQPDPPDHRPNDNRSPVFRRLRLKMTNHHKAVALSLTGLLVAISALIMYPDVVESKERRSDHPAKNDHQINRMINPGERINIPCSVVGPGGSVQWIQNGKPILLDFSVTQRRHWNISNDGQAALTINRVTKADEGVWECWELAVDGKVKQKAVVMKLTVTNIPEEPFIELEGRRLAEQATITVREKNVITLRCVVRGASPPVSYIHWYLADQNETQSSQLLMEYLPEEDVSMAISVLVVNVTRQLHSKMVFCRVHHVSWSNPATVSASFNVLYVPEFSISRQPGFGFPIVEGMSVSLKCEIDANPLSTPKWSRDLDLKTPFPELETDSDGTINLTVISKKDTGWYRCTTEHHFGHFASFAYYLNVRSSNQLAQVQNVLQPPMLGNSIDNKEMAPSEAALTKTQQEARTLVQAASISSSPDMMAMNSGHHHKHHHERHNIFNEHHHRKECNDNNNGKPVIESINRTLTALLGKHFYLTAKFCCNPRPKKVYWIHRHLAMTPGRVIGSYVTRDLINAKNSMFCYLSMFEIDPLKPEDAGEVVLIVSNSRGLDEASVMLNITQASFSISRGTALSTIDNNTLVVFLLLTIIVQASEIWQRWMLMETIMKRASQS